MIEPAVFFALLMWVSFCFAKVEIAVEGDNGWAGGLPTWRLPSTNWASLLFFSGKPMTGYHVWVETFIFSILHIVYVFVPFSVQTELQIFSFFMLFTVLEDFLWFVFNPAFGVRNFRKEKIWWHAGHWWWIAPRDYFLFVPLGIALYTAAMHV